MLNVVGASARTRSLPRCATSRQTTHGPDQEPRHSPRNGRSPHTARSRLSVSTASARFARFSRPCFPEPSQGYLRPWMLLAPPLLLPRPPHSTHPPRVLGPKAPSQRRKRPGCPNDALRNGMGRNDSLGVRAGGHGHYDAAITRVPRRTGLIGLIELSGTPCSQGVFVPNMFWYSSSGAIPRTPSHRRHG